MASLQTCRLRALPRHVALAAICLAALIALPAPVAAQARQQPSFREAPPSGSIGGKRLTPTCRVQGIISGGVINFVNPEAEAKRRKPKVRGIATRLMTRSPVSTTLVLRLAAGGEARLAAIEAAFRAGGLEVTGRELRPVSPEGQEASFRLAGEVDPLAAALLLPPDAAEALLRVSHELPPPDAVAAPLRRELEAAAEADARNRAEAHGAGAALGSRIRLDFPRSRGPSAGNRRTVELSAVATHVLSLPPGASFPGE